MIRAKTAVSALNALLLAGVDVGQRGRPHTRAQEARVTGVDVARTHADIDPPEGVDLGVDVHQVVSLRLEHPGHLLQVGLVPHTEVGSEGPAEAPLVALQGTTREVRDPPHQLTGETDGELRELDAET